MRRQVGRRLDRRLLGWLRLLVVMVLVGPAFASGSVLAAPPPPRDLDREDVPVVPATILEQERLAPDTLATLVQIPAAEDAYIASGYPNQNFGDDPLFLGYNATGDEFGAERILMRFNVLSAVPPGAHITDAYVQLTLNYASPADDAPLGTNLRAVGSAWDEAAVTWNTQPVRGDIRTTVFVGTALTTYEWHITDLVQAWVDGALTNNGVEIYGDEFPEQRERTFYSRESATGNSPRLVVDFTVSDDTEPPVVNIEPLPAYSPRNFEVVWSGTDPGGSGIATYDVDYRVDGGDWIPWIYGTTDTSAAFTGENGHLYDFRARGVDIAGNVEPFGGPEATTTVDTQPPVAIVQPLPAVTHSSSFNVSWSAGDSVSGIAYYDVRYRYNNGAWTVWQVKTLATTAPFTAADDGVYAFEARAVDNAGRVEMLTGQPEAATAVDVEAPFMAPRLRLPAIFKNAP